MKIKKELYRSARIVFFTAFCFCSALFFSCENFLNGSDLRKSLEHEIAYANAPYASIQIYADPDAKYTMLPSEGIYDKLYKSGDKFTLDYTPKSSYVFITWECIPENSVEFADSRSTKTEATIRKADEQIKIQPLCVERGKLKVSFSATHGTTVPSEEKSYYSGDAFSLRYTEDGDYAFTGWKIVDLATGQEASDVLEFDGNGKDVTVTVKKTDMSIKVVAESKERPAVMDFAPGFKGEGVFIDSVLKYIFSQPMSLSSIYWTESELAEMGISSETHELLEAVYEDVDQKDEDGNPYYYAYKEKDDAAGISLKFKNYEIYRRGTTENLLMHYGCPGFDVTRSVLSVPVNRDNMPPKITEIEFKVHKAMTNENGIDMASAFKKFYFTSATSDNLPPEFSSLKVVQIDENGESELSQEANDVIFTVPENLKSLNRAKKNFKIKVKGSVSDTGSKPAKLTAALKPQYSDYYDEGKRVDANEVMLALAGSVSDFTEEGYIFDFTGKINTDGVYDLAIIASDNSGNKKEELFRIIYDHTAPEVSKFEYDSTIAQDWVKYRVGNRTKDCEKTVIKGFTNESALEIFQDDLLGNKIQEFKGLKCTRASRWHTIEITECDYLGNERTRTERIYAVPAVGMYYSKYADEKDTTKDKEYWTSIKDDAKVISGIILGHLASEDDFSKMRAFVSTRIAQYGNNPVYDYWSRVDEGNKRPSGYKDKIKNEKDGLMLLKYIEENFPAMKTDTKNVTYNGNPTNTKSLWNNCWTEENQPSSSLPPPPGMSRFVYLDNTYIPTITELTELFTIENINKIMKDNDYLQRWYMDSTTSQYWLFSSSLFIVDGYQELVNVYEPKSRKGRCAPKHPDRNSSDNKKINDEGALIKFGESGKHLCEVYFTQINMEE